MKGRRIILCHSITGNSYYIANDIAACIDAEVLPMNSSNARLPSEKVDSLGLIFPVYYVGMPVEVVEFMKQLTINHSKIGYVYIVVTCSRYQGNALYQAIQLLNQKGAAVDVCQKIIISGEDNSKWIEDKSQLIHKLCEYKRENPSYTKSRMLQWHYERHIHEFKLPDAGSQYKSRYSNLNDWKDFSLRKFTEESTDKEKLSDE